MTPAKVLAQEDSLASRQNSKSRKLPFGATFLALSLTACGLAVQTDDSQILPKVSDMIHATPQSFADIIKKCPAKSVRIDMPHLGNSAPPVRVLYPKEICAGVQAGHAGIFVMARNHWNLVYNGPYSRGNNRVDRGGKAYTYWLVSDTASNAALRYKKEQLVLTIKNVDTLLLESLNLEKDINDR